MNFLIGCSMISGGEPPGPPPTGRPKVGADGHDSGRSHMAAARFVLRAAAAVARAPPLPRTPARHRFQSDHADVRKTSDGPMGVATGPTSHAKPFREERRREHVESLYFTSASANLVAPPSRLRWGSCAEPDP